MLGPGLLESTYQRCLARELRLAGHRVEVEHPISIQFRGERIDCAYRVDLFVDETIVVETKAVSELAPIHRAQVKTYLNWTRCSVGLLLNFNVTRLSDGGIQRVVHQYDGPRPEAMMK